MMSFFAMLRKYSLLPGLTETFHVKHEGRIYRNPLGPLVEDLDALPDPDRQVLYDAAPGLLNMGTKPFVSARGCPYRCSYCFNEEYNKNYKNLGTVARFRSPERVVEEIARIKERYPLSMVLLNDDVVTLKPHGWLQEFYNPTLKLIARQTKIRKVV